MTAIPMSARAIVDTPLDAALEYHRRGWSVIPLRPRDKKPAMAWARFQQKQASKAEVATWNRQYPGANLGIVTGAVSGIIVLDVDDASAWDNLFFEYDVPRTPTAQTGKGWHLYFAHPGGVVKNFARKLPGLDLRGDGGYVVAPPSVHPNGGAYQWEISPDDTTLAPAPDWLLDLIHNNEPAPAPMAPLEPSGPPHAYTLYAERALADELAKLASAQNGTRNDTLNRSAFSLGTLIGAGVIERAYVESSLFNIARVLGLGEEETTKTIRSGLDKGIAKPRVLPALEPRTTPAASPIATPTTTQTIQLAPPVAGEVARPVGATWADLEQVIAPISWAWPGWLPNGLLTMVAADSGTGKSALCLRLAACFIRGEPWPDGTPYDGDTGRVLWCEAEAAQAVNLERAKEWGLPMNAFQSPLANPLDDLHLDDPAHRDAMAAWAHQPDIKFVVLDSFSGSHSYDETSSEARELVKWLAELCRNSGKPIALIHHLRKRGTFDTGEEVTLDRVRGGSALVQTARVVWALDIPNPTDKEHKRLSVIKNNLARFSESIGLRIASTGVAFGNAPAIPHKETLQDRAEDLLLAILNQGNGRRLASEIIEELEQAGISKHAGYRAKDTLNLVSFKDGSRWYWALPVQEED